MKKPLVSIVIPTYGRNESLKNAVISAENQTYKNIEIIVVDDNNPETEYRRKNSSLMKTLCKQYKNIRYVKHDRNKNGAAARNTGIRRSSGEYIAFLDDDDEFLPKKIEIQLGYLQANQKCKCVGCSYKQGKKIIKNTSYGDVSKEILMLRYCFTTSMLFFEKESLIRIGCFDEKFVRHQDYELLLKYCKHYKIGKLDKVLLIKGKNDGENIPTGKRAVKNKKLFLKTFSNTINAINVDNPGFKNDVFYENYFDLFKDELRGKYILLSIRYGFLSFVRKPLTFIMDIVKMIMRKVG